MLFGASFVSLGSVPVVTEGNCGGRMADSTFRKKAKVLLKFEDWLDCSVFYRLYMLLGKSAFLGVGGGCFRREAEALSFCSFKRL